MPYHIITLADATWDTFVYIQEARLECSVNKTQCILGLKYGDKIPVDAMAGEVGGNAANVAVGTAKLGLKSALLGSIGDDANGKKIKKLLALRGVVTKYLRMIPGTNTNSSVVITFKGERTILTYHPSRPAITLRLPQSDWIYFTQTYSSALIKQVLARARNGKSKLAFNPGSTQIRKGLSLLKPYLRLTDILFVNKEEAEALLSKKSLTGKKYIKGMLKALFHLGSKIVVITNGREGSYSYDGNEYLFMKTYPAKRLEPTGAGDSFSSGFLGAIIHKKQVGEALAWGTVNSAGVITKIGSQIGLLSKTQMKQRAKSHKTFKAKRI